MADSQKGPLDGMYRDTNIVILVLFGLCCSFIALILSLVAYFTGKDEKAKSNAMIVIIISGIMAVLNVVGIIVQIAAIGVGAAAGAR